MASVVSPSSASSPPTTVYLRRGHNTANTFRRLPTVRSLVLSEMFLPKENASSLSAGRSRSACRSCLIMEPLTDDLIPSLSPATTQNRKSNSSTLQRSSSLLTKLQSLFLIKRPAASQSTFQKSPTVPKMPPPLVNYGPFASHFRGRSQSSVSRHYQRSKKNTSAQASPARSVGNEPLIYSTPLSNLTSTNTSLTSFTSSPTSLQRPKNLPLVHRRQRNAAVPSAPTVQQKHFSAHLPGEVLHPPLTSQSSSGLWSASSIASLGATAHRSANIRPMAPVTVETKSLLGLRERSPSPSISSNDSAVDLIPCTTAKSEWNPRQRRPTTNQSSHYSGVYTSSVNCIYEEVPPQTLATTPGLNEKTPTTAQPSGQLGDPSLARSASTTTLTSVETEAEPTYAVPQSTAATAPTGPFQPPAPPPLPPKGMLHSALLEMEGRLVCATPPALTASPQPPVFEEKSVHHRRAASTFRASHQHSPLFDHCIRGRRPASTVSPSGSITITAASSSTGSWYADILPYKPSTLPETLADRLRQPDRFILSTPTPPCEDLMTRSLFEQHQPPEGNARLMSSRSASRTRPVSFHDAPSTTINLPSLDHLLKPSESRKTLPQPSEVAPPLKGFLMQDPLQVLPSDSPLLGQYCRLKLVIPPSSSTTSASTSSGIRTSACSTFM